ncbi:MAG: hypothetical protein V2I40_10695 [Desulfobacteraceae bacterium]|nr:hypothetical protein [Desulfobacteraceae bacterium]
MKGFFWFDITARLPADRSWKTPGCRTPLMAAFEGLEAADIFVSRIKAAAHDAGTA